MKGKQFAIMLGSIVLVCILLGVAIKSCTKKQDIVVLHPTQGEIDSLNAHEKLGEIMLNNLVETLTRTSRAKDSLDSITSVQAIQLQLKTMQLNSLVEQAKLVKKYKDTAAYINYCDTIIPRVTELTATAERYRKENRTLKDTVDYLIGTHSLAMARLEYMKSECDSAFNRVAQNALKLETSNAKLSKVKKFGLGAQVGGTFYNGKIIPYAGIGISYNFFRF